MKKILSSVISAGGELVNYTLFTPGPIDVPDEILKEISKPLVYHREEKFSELLNITIANLKKILYTKNKIFIMTSSGTGAMETACANVLSTKDEPVVAICGKFGQRWLDLCESYNVEPTVLKKDYGKSIPPEKIEEVLKKKNKPAIVFTTLVETSTGALNDIKSFGEICKKYNAYFVVDEIAGIGVDFCPQDDWHVDIAVGASQKGLMSPPGVSFISINERAFKKTVQSDLPKYYFNLQIFDKFISKGQTPWTPAINTIYGLKKGTDRILKIGLDENFNNHKEMAAYVRERITKLGFELLAENPSNALTVIKMPDSLDSTEIINELKEKHQILFANGQGELKGKIIRIGHMGNYNIKKIGKAIDALESVLKKRRR
jgi:aspartate aminotransferase-like enzyme